MTVTLTAKEPNLFANTPTDSVRTTVKYKSTNDPIALWWRISGKGWEHQNLVSGPPPASDANEALAMEMEGERDSQFITPGQFIDYGILPKGIDPRTTPLGRGRFLAFITIFAFLKDPNPDLITVGMDIFGEAGGTFRFRRLETTEDTLCITQVGRKRPQKFQNTQFFTMDEPLKTITSDFKKVHEIEVQPLVPGTSFFELTRVSDRRGNWWFINEPFDTKQRKVRVEFRKFIVIDDGDFDLFNIPDAGEAEIFFQVWKDDEKIFEVPFKGDISDEPGANVVLLNNMFKEIDPEPYNGTDKRIGIGAEGKEWDCVSLFGADFFCSSENSGIQPKFPSTARSLRIEFPTGRGNETVNPPPDTTTMTAEARPNPNDGSLHYKVELRHVVVYV